MNEISSKIKLADKEIFEAYQNEYLKKFDGKYPPFEWIDWRSKFSSEQELLKYCIVNNKQWFEVIEPIEEGVRINYKKGVIY